MQQSSQPTATAALEVPGGCPAQAPGDFRRLPLVLWALYLLAWTAALLTPNPARAVAPLIPSEYRFLAAKAVHVSAYAVLALLSGWLQLPPRLRGWLALFLLAHASGTEFCQQFIVTRTPSWRDVGLNLLGLLLGAAVGWKRWTAAGQGQPECCPALGPSLTATQTASSRAAP